MELMSVCIEEQKTIQKTFEEKENAAHTLNKKIFSDEKKNKEIEQSSVVREKDLIIR